MLSRQATRTALLLVVFSISLVIAAGCQKEEPSSGAAAPAAGPAVVADNPQSEADTPASSDPDFQAATEDDDMAPVPLGTTPDIVYEVGKGDVPDGGLPRTDLPVLDDPDLVAPPETGDAPGHELTVEPLTWVDDGHDYYVVALDDLQIGEGRKLPAGLSDAANRSRSWQIEYWLDSGQFGFSVAAPAEAYLAGPWMNDLDRLLQMEPAPRAPLADDVVEQAVPNRARLPRRDTDSVDLIVRVPREAKVSGTLFLDSSVLNSSGDGEIQNFKFTVPADSLENTGENQDTFWLARVSYYYNLMWREGPGAAWYRYQLQVSADHLGAGLEQPRRQRSSFNDHGLNLERTYGLLSGGRALAENLQLDRELPTSSELDETIPLESITGITVKEFDWKPLVEGLEPELDPLATLIPADQHVIFFNDFASMIAVMDEASQNGLVIMNVGTSGPRSEDAGSQARYGVQFGLSMNATVRLLGPTIIRSVAVTGGDPYLRTGADVAVLFEAVNAAALQALLNTQIQAQVSGYESAVARQGMVGGIPYQAQVSPDRVVCSYTATLGDAVVVTNSLVQLQQLVEVFQHERASIAELDEYTFFRDRYPLGKEGQSGLLVLSDQTIRRWCGPRWRIASSRRTRALAAMTQYQAEHLDNLVAGNVDAGPLKAIANAGHVGQLRLTSTGVISDSYGSLDFQTPIIELEMEKVTPEEARLYQRWRQGYQRNWSNFFDPIAVEFSVQDDRLNADVTVMPLIANSEYNELIEVSSGATLSKDAGDRHKEAIAHFVLAINTDSDFLKQNINLLGTFAPQIKVDPLSWVGDHVTIYADKSEFWQRLAESTEQEWGGLFEEHINEIPVGVAVDVKNGLKLAIFLTGFRAFIEESAPGMTRWDTVNYKEQGYVAIRPTQQALGDLPAEVEKLAIYYRATGKQFLLSLDEKIIQRAIDRELAVAAVDDDAGFQPWSGDNVGLELGPEAVSLIKKAAVKQAQGVMQQLSWSNLPILNEWHLRYPDRDPVELHQQFWQRRLVCPGGGEYRWNEDLQTMESTVYGCPAARRDGPGLPAAFERIKSINFGLSFETNGLRSTFELKKK